jgi:hypothetical protein
MSEARSLTALSENDYEAIAGAVMETARGRWFMAEFAKRNRQADTTQLLTAIGRIERVVGMGQEQSAPDSNLREAAALIADLRLDLERISGRGAEPSSGLAARIEGAAGAVIAATEGVQEAAWSLREAGADDAACDALDKRATEIHVATAIIESTAQQIGKIADTIAMLDSSLRAFSENAQDFVMTPPQGFSMAEAAPLGSYEDIEIVEIDEAPKSTLAESRAVSARPLADLKQHPSTLLTDDVVFEEIDAPGDPLQAPHVLAAATSEAELRALDALTPAAKLAYFA